MESYNDIIGLQFLPMDDEFIQKIAVTQVSAPDLGNNQIRPDSVTSSLMGSVSESKDCETCHNKRSKCAGHPGFIRLGAPVLSSIFIPEIISYLKIICWECGRLIVKNVQMRSLKKVLTSITAKIKKGIVCEWCGATHPHVYENRKEGRSHLVQELYSFSHDTKESKKLWARDLFPSEVRTIFSRLTSETLALLGIKSPELSPLNFVNENFYVLPNSIRPNATSFGASKTSKHDINIQINNILKESRKLGDTSQGFDPVRNTKILKDLAINVYGYRMPVPSASDKKPVSLALDLAGKTGVIRGEVLGARILRIMRHFITGNPSARLDEVLVPLNLARDIQIEETVTPFNREYLMRFVANGDTVYPRCTAIFKKSTGLYYTLRVKKDIILENGDKIYRDLIDNDEFAFCRQPTLMKSNITALKARIYEGKTFAFNPNNTTLFGADFDGDEMNGYFSKDKISAYDLARMGGVHEAIISNGYGAPMIGQVQDGTLGCALLTRDAMRLNMMSACRMFDNTGLFPTFEGRKFPISGRDVFTELFRICGVKINYSSKATYFKPNLNPYREYSPTEVNVEIKNGVFVSGIIDKKAVGSKAYNGLYHKIYNKYGAQITMDICWYMQQIAINFLFIAGFTMHLNDFNLGGEQYENILRTEKSIIAESQIHTENLHAGNIVPPPGKTTEEFYESEQRKILASSESYNEYIHKGLDYENNHLYFAIHSGSKGSTTNLAEGAIACGQISVRDKRLKKNLAGRSSHFFPRDSVDPRARGFITNSYFRGLSPVDLVNASYAHRIGLIDKALSTADSGTKYREAISSLDSLVTNFFRGVMKGQKLRQTLYGGDGMDPRGTFKTFCELARKTDSELNSLKTEPGELEALKSARNFLRKLYINFQERTEEPFGGFAYIPVNYPLILSDIVSSKSEGKPASYTIARDFIRNLPRLYFNAGYKGNLPDYANEACTLFQAYLTWELRSEVCKSLSQHQMDILLRLIENSFINNLEDAGACVGIRSAQAISEPNTQQMLDSIHGKAGNKIINFKNIMSATTAGKMKNASMEIYLRDPSKELTQAFAKKIEMLKFRYFVNTYQIFYESFANVVHPKYKHEIKIIRKRAELMQPPSDLTNWCIRFDFNISRLISQNVTIEDIYIQIIRSFEWTYIVHETLNSENLFIRVYLRQEAGSSYKLTESHELKVFAEDLLDLTIRGVNGIKGTEVKSREITFVDETSALKTKSIYFVVTEGTNMSEILLYPEVDGRMTRSNAISEIQDFFGITCARNAAIDGLRGAVDGAYYSHYEVFADEMCSTHEFTALNRNGSASRGTSICQLIADSSFMRFLKLAVKKGKIDYNIGPNTSMIMGTTAKIGTNFAEVALNEEFVDSFANEQNEELENI